MSWPTYTGGGMVRWLLLALHEKGELLLRLGVRKELVAGLLGEGLEVLHRAGVGGDDLQHLAGGHLVQRLLGAQDGQRAVEPAGVEFFVEVHEEILISKEVEVISRTARAARPPCRRARCAPRFRLASLRGSCTKPSRRTPGRAPCAP